MARTGVDKQAITLYDARQHPGSTSDSRETWFGGTENTALWGFCSYQMCGNGARTGCKPAKNGIPGIRARQTYPHPQHVRYLFHHGGRLCKSNTRCLLSVGWPVRNAIFRSSFDAISSG